MRSGDDPKEEWASQQSRTFDDLAKDYLEKHFPNWKKVPRPATMRNYKILVNTHLVPAFGNRQAEDIQREDIERLHVSMRERPCQANRMFQNPPPNLELSRFIGILEKFGQCEG